MSAICLLHLHGCISCSAEPCSERAGKRASTYICAAPGSLAACLELLLSVLQLSVRTKLLGSKPSKPTLGFTISRDVEYKQVNALFFLHSKHALASKAVFFWGLFVEYNV